jgi:tRNA(fMet)-specific endonuclease VapC
MTDTNVIGMLLAGNAKLRTRFGMHLGAIGLSSIVLFELHYGFAKSRTSATNFNSLSVFLNSGVAVIPFDESDAAVAGSLRQKMESAGMPMGSFDLLIAAQALRLGATLVTSDAAFSGVDGLPVVDWTI